MKNQIKMHQVKSSNVKAIGHHHGDVLRVEYQGGSVYDYHGVQEKTFNDIMASPSVGKAINSLGIKGRKVIEE